MHNNKTDAPVSAEMTDSGDGRPRVSVVISAYNKQDYIAATVESVLAQTESAVEALVVDDCSTDATRDIVRDLARKDPRVRLIALEHNVGQPAALNVGLEAATGEWLAILDGDDWVAPDLYAGLLTLAQRSGASVLASDMQWVADGKMRPWDRLLPPGLTKPLKLSAADFIRRSMPHQLRPLSFLQPMMRREIVAEHGVRYDESDRFDLDFGILVRAILACGPLVVSPAVDYYYRQVPGSMMSTCDTDVLRLMKGSNDALIADCRDAGDMVAADLIARRSRAMQGEIERSDLVASLRAGHVAQVARRLAGSPAYAATLLWRRIRPWPFWAWRATRQMLGRKTATWQTVAGVAGADAAWQLHCLAGNVAAIS